MAQLEKSKADKKRMGEMKYQQPKRARANGGYYGSRMPVAAVDRQPPVFNDRGAYMGKPPVFNEMGPYMGVPERYPNAGPTTYDYQAPSQGAYGQQPNAQTQRPYHYPQDQSATATTHNAAPSDYGGYNIASGLQSSHQPYM